MIKPQYYCIVGRPSRTTLFIITITLHALVKKTEMLPDIFFSLMTCETRISEQYENPDLNYGGKQNSARKFYRLDYPV